MKISGIETLAPEQWNRIADTLEVAAAPLAGMLKEYNHEGRGEEDADEYLAHMQCAVVAVRYVAEFASDKCKFIIAEHKDLN